MGSPAIPCGSPLSISGKGGGNSVCDPVSECCTLGWFTLIDGTQSHDSPTGRVIWAPSPLSRGASGAEVDSAEGARFLPKTSLRAVKVGRLRPATACVPLGHCLTGPGRALSPPFYRGTY